MLKYIFQNKFKDFMRHGRVNLSLKYLHLVVEKKHKSLC